MLQQIFVEKERVRDRKIYLSLSPHSLSQGIVIPLSIIVRLAWLEGEIQWEWHKIFFLETGSTGLVLWFGNPYLDTGALAPAVSLLVIREKLSSTSKWSNWSLLPCVDASEPVDLNSSPGFLSLNLFPKLVKLGRKCFGLADVAGWADVAVEFDVADAVPVTFILDFGISEPIWVGTTTAKLDRLVGITGATFWAAKSNLENDQIGGLNPQLSNPWWSQAKNSSSIRQKMEPQ